LDSIHPYGVLLVRIGADDPSFIAIGSKNDIPAYRDGFLEFRIHDADPCLVDNAGTVTVTVEERDNLPYPSWWNGAACDTLKVPTSATLGAYYRGIPACGPPDLPTDNSTVVTFPGGWGEWEWQCVELSMRFMWLAYGIKAYDANGNEVVDHYTDPQRNPA